MIKSFRDKDTQSLFRRQRVLRFKDFEGAALRKLNMVNAATTRQDLRVPLGNHLERLKGKRKGQDSIMINDQWRVCFVWGKDNHAYGVEICDYHK